MIRDLLQTAFLANDLMGKRDELKLIWGADYHKRIRKTRVLLKAVAHNHKLPILEATRQLVTRALDDGQRMVAWMLIAAGVDLSESPSGGEAGGA